MQDTKIVKKKIYICEIFSVLPSILFIYSNLLVLHLNECFVQNNYSLAKKKKKNVC